MPFQLADSTSNTQRFSVSNVQQTELGSATPSAQLSVNGRPVLNADTLSQTSVAPAAMPRITGAVNLGPGLTSTISIGAGAGFSSVDGPGQVVNYNGDHTQMRIVGTGTTASNMNYASF
jgi:hypothetical protein